MSATVAPSASASSASPAATAGVMLLGNAAAPSGLFMNFMSLFGNQIAGQTELSLNQTVVGNDTGSTQASTAQFGQSGFNFDPALLVLPTGVANLSEEDLKAFLSSQANGNTDTLGSNILASLTAGIPTLPGKVQLTNESIAATDATTAAATDAATDIFNIKLAALTANKNVTTEPLTTSDSQASKAEQLLIATGLSPAQIEQMKEQLAASAKAAKDATDVSDATNLAFVSFVVPVAQPVTSEKPSDGTAIKVGTSASGTPNRLMSFEKAGDDSSGMQSPTSDTPLQAALAGAQSKDSSPHMGSHSDSVSSDKSKTDDSQNSSTTLTFPQVSQMFSLSSGSSTDLTSGMIPLAGSALTGAQQTASSLTAPLLNNPSAVSAHPATQAIAATIEKATGKSGKTDQSLLIQLDPPELGRVQIQLSYEKGEPLKVHLLTEKKDTFNLLQRDSHALQSALDKAGIQMDGSSLTFDMAGGENSFNQLLGQSQDGSSGNSGSGFSLDGNSSSSTTDVVLNVEMNSIPDFTNGSYNFYA